MVEPRLWKIWVRQLGLLFPIYGNIKHVPNHHILYPMIFLFGPSSKPHDWTIPIDFENPCVSTTIFPWQYKTIYSLNSPHSRLCYIHLYQTVYIYIYHNRYVYHGMSSYSNDIFIWVSPKMGDPQHILLMENSILRGTTISGNLHPRPRRGDLARRSLESAPAVPAAATPLGRCSPRWYPDEIMGSLERCGLS